MNTKIVNISKIFTFSKSSKSVQSLQNHEIEIKNGKIVNIAPSIEGNFKTIDAENAIITPGFIDSHTHPIFISNRADEFEKRNLGRSYRQIENEGGGIINSVLKLRDKSEDELFELCYNRVNQFLDFGTTTIEAKSGYGLTYKDEIKSLNVIKNLNNELKLDIIPTFMGAHAVPPEYKNNQYKYVDLICEKMIPEIASRKLAIFCDVFCEKGYFEYRESKKILETAKKFGLIPRLHADEFLDSRAAELAAEIGAVSADHLMAANDIGLKKMADNGVIATILPSTTYFLRSNNYVSGKKLKKLGCTIALATDFNPGSSTTQSLLFVMQLANLYCEMNSDDIFKATTYNAAKAIKLDHNKGIVDLGYDADLIFWELSDFKEIPYWASNSYISKVMKKGELI